MPEIRIEQTTFERLQCHAQPLIDTVDAVVNRALDALETGMPKRADQDPLRFQHEFGPDSLPDLTHTKVLSAMLDGGEVARPNWNRLLVSARLETG